MGLSDYCNLFVTFLLCNPGILPPSSWYIVFTNLNRRHDMLVTTAALDSYPKLL
jgi:hypothetical protein